MTTYPISTESSLPEGFARVRYPSPGTVGVVHRVLAEASNVVRLHLVDDEVIFDEPAHEVPEWARRVVVELSRLEHLPHDWDSYGGVPLSRQHMLAALGFLSRVMTDDTEVPDIVPLADGGVQLEWRVGDLHVDFISDEETDGPVVYVTEAGGDQELPGREGAQFFVEHLRDRVQARGAVVG